MNETLTKYQISKIRYAEEEEYLEKCIIVFKQNKSEILNNIYVFRRKKRPKSRLFLVHIGTVKKLLMTKEETIYLLSKHGYIKSEALVLHGLFELTSIRKFIESLN
jgi:hypothetical protein